MEIKFYVRFINYTGATTVHCFECNEMEAMHFAEMVNGKIIKETDGRIEA